MSDVKALVDGKISGKKVMVFSKTTCPFCKMAKDSLGKFNLGEEEIEVMEIDRNPDMNAIQEYLKKLTGAKTVPRVFINGKCIGGGSETQQLEKSGELKVMLGK